MKKPKPFRTSIWVTPEQEKILRALQKRYKQRGRSASILYCTIEIGKKEGLAK